MIMRPVHKNKRETKIMPRAKRAPPPPVDTFKLSEFPPRDLSDEELQEFLYKHTVLPLREEGVWFTWHGNCKALKIPEEKYLEMCDNRRIFHMDEVHDAMRLIAQHVTPGSSHSSYTLKHVLEPHSKNIYLGNGETISAMLLLGGEITFKAGGDHRLYANATMWAPLAYPDIPAPPAPPAPSASTAESSPPLSPTTGM